MPPPLKKRRLDADFKNATKHDTTTLDLNHSKGQLSLRQKANQLLESREKLPIWTHQDEIREKVQENDVVVLIGETGSGKSTQIPQFLCSEDWCAPRIVETSSRTHASVRSKIRSSETRIGGRIAIIQPRRVAAISLATRVAAESGSLLGSASPASTVGYSVRFDNNVSPSTKIKFLTDGMLLQELLRDQWLREYSCVVVDEVHERGINVDLVLGFLRRILEASRIGNEEDGRSGVPLKIIVMSATAEMEGIKTFFRENVSENDGRNEDKWEDLSDRENHHSDTQSSAQSEVEDRIKVASCFIEGRQFPVTTLYNPTPVINLLDAAMDKIMHIHQHTPLPGNVLVFLSGQEMIENLESLCHTYAQTLIERNKQQSNVPKKSQQAKLPTLQVLPLFASLPTHLQSRIFQPTPPFTRRIILATNIAETSITVPGIRYVVDTGKHKSRLFRPGLNLDTLLSTPISQSMAKQRAGRAGREAPGQCYRLYTQKDYLDLEKDTKPEILSTDLSFLVLTLKAHGVDDVLRFPLLTKPPRRSLEAALEGLLSLDALDVDTGEITEIGKKMAMLPVRPDLARILLEGTRNSKEIAEGVIDIVAALSLEEGIFLPVQHSNQRKLNGAKKTNAEDLLLPTKNGKKASKKTATDNPSHKDSDSDSDPDSEDITNPVESARRTLLSRHSDHMTLLNAIRAYSAPTTHDRRAWCNSHGVSHRAMSRIMDVRKQLRQMLQSPKFRLPSTVTVANDHTDTSSAETSLALSNIFARDAILKCLVAGLWTNVALHSSIAPQTAQTAHVNPNQRAPYTTLLTGQGIHIHPSSVLFVHRGAGASRQDDADTTKHSSSSAAARGSTMPRAIVFTDLVYTSKAYARNVSAVELSWIADMGKM